MGFARVERAAVCDALADAGPDAPTLCEGWTTHDLAAHLWLRENDPLAVSGSFIKPLAPVTDARTDALKSRWTYEELVARIRRGPRLASLFAIPAVDELANVVEFFVHAEDVRRPAGLEPRPQTPEFEALLARNLATIGKALLRRADCGVVLERTDIAERLVARPGTRIVTLRGTPSELLLYVFGRVDGARVQAIGDPDAVDALARALRGH